MPKLIASDLDGTFLTADGSVTDANIAAVTAAKAAGIEIVFITGRPARWLRGVAEVTNHFGLMIGGNGAFIADMEAMEVVWNAGLQPENAVAAVERIMQDFPDAHFAIERSFVGMPIAKSIGLRYDEYDVGELSHYEFATTAGYSPGWPGNADIPRGDIRELAAMPDITKLVVKPGDPNGWNSDTWLAAITPLVQDLVQLTHASEHTVLAEISRKGVTKATALADLAGRLGISAADVVAVGDMPNDLPMLAWAGEAWTVANAHPDVLAATSNVLPHHDESPVATLIADILSR